MARLALLARRTAALAVARAAASSIMERLAPLAPQTAVLGRLFPAAVVALACCLKGVKFALRTAVHARRFQAAVTALVKAFWVKSALLALRTAALARLFLVAVMAPACCLKRAQP